MESVKGSKFVPTNADQLNKFDSIFTRDSRMLRAF